MDNILESIRIPKNADIVYLGGTFGHIKKGANNSNKKLIKIDINKLKLYGTFAYYIPSAEKIRDLYNVFFSTFIDSPKSKDVHPNWRSGTVKLRAQNADRVLINHFQKNGTTYVVNPVKIYHIDNNISTIGNNVKRYGLKFYYNENQKEYIEDMLGI